MTDLWLLQDLLFAADTPWNWAAEKNYARLKAEHPEIAHSAKKGENVVNGDGLVENQSVVNPAEKQNASQSRREDAGRMA